MYSLRAFAFTPAAIISEANECRHGRRHAGELHGAQPQPSQAIFTVAAVPD